MHRGDRPIALDLLQRDRVVALHEHDVIARVEASTVDELGKLVIAKIQDVEGITRTLTCPVVHV